MKKFTVLMLAALLVVAFAMPASALENIFGGYWRTRFISQRNFDGDDAPTATKGTGNVQEVNTRTRLYYTAKINDNLKLVNKFEFDTVWGNKDQNGTVSGVTSAATGGTATTGLGTSTTNWGDAGADGIAVEIKNSYADFNVGPVNFLVGAHQYKLARGFISDDDASGIHATWKVNDGLYLPFAWNKHKEGGAGRFTNDQDVDMYVVAPIIMLSKDIRINPYYVFLHAKNGTLMGQAIPSDLMASNAWPVKVPTYAYGLFNDINASAVGLDFDAKMGPASLWFTGIYQFGDIEFVGETSKTKLKGYLLAGGGTFDLGKADIHGQVFYATGDDPNSDDIKAFFTTSSTTYYWAEIMGGGVFDWASGGSGINSASNNSPGLAPSNILAANLGVTVKPMAKLSVSADIWYAKLNEEIEFSNGKKADYLGTEIDLKATYQLVEGLNLDLVAAYLFAGDATSFDGKNNANPVELGMQLSLAF